MPTDIPSNITSLISALSAELNSISSAQNSSVHDKHYEILPKHPPFFQRNKSLRTLLIAQINQLVSQLNGLEIEKDIADKDKQKQAELKILLLHLRIELLHLKEAMIT